MRDPGRPVSASAGDGRPARFHQWQRNLRILDVKEIKTVAYVPLSHPLVERLIGTVRRECLDRTARAPPIGADPSSTNHPRRAANPERPGAAGPARQPPGARDADRPAPRARHLPPATREPRCHERALRAAHRGGRTGVPHTSTSCNRLSMRREPSTSSFDGGQHDVVVSARGTDSTAGIDARGDSRLTMIGRIGQGTSEPSLDVPLGAVIAPSAFVSALTCPPLV